MTRSAIAPRFIAFENARLTRTSLNGFLSSGLPDLSNTNGDLSRSLSRWKKIMRLDEVMNTPRSLWAFTLAKSCGGITSIICTSPASSAATRAASLVRSRKTQAGTHHQLQMTGYPGRLEQHCLFDDHYYAVTSLHSQTSE